MGYEMDKELLEEFLGEAGEVISQLKRVLTDLEQRPADESLLYRLREFNESGLPLVESGRA